MTKAMPYVRERDGVYQFERRVPLRIQRDPRRFAELFGSKPLYRRSFRTKDEAAMEAAWSRYNADFKSLTGAAASSPVVIVPSVQSPRVLTDDDLQAIARRSYDLIVDPFESLHRLANVDAAAAEELARLEYAIELDGPGIEATLRSRQVAQDGPILRPADEARHIVAERGYIAPEGSEQLGAVVGAVRRGMNEGYARLAALGSGEATPALPKPVERKDGRLALTLAVAVERYLEARKPPPKAASETMLALRQFEQAVGNKLLSAITRDDMHTFVRFLADQKVGGKTVESIVRHLSAHTIGKRLRMLSVAINHAKDRGWLASDNPARNIRVATIAKTPDKAVMPDKRRLRTDELNLIFAHPWFTGCKSAAETHLPGNHRLQGCEYWAPVMAAFTGCRAAELGGMRLADVRLGDRYPHLIVRDNEYRRTKSKRTRCVPILDALLELGFADYVERIAVTGADRLFPDWTARVARNGSEAGYPAWSNAKVIRAFNRTVLPMALGDRLAPGVRRDVTFHALRGAFKALLGITYNLHVNIVHEIIGHAKSELDERYIGGITIEETYPKVHRCKYDVVIIQGLGEL